MSPSSPLLLHPPLHLQRLVQLTLALLRLHRPVQDLTQLQCNNTEQADEASARVLTYLRVVHFK